MSKSTFNGDPLVRIKQFVEAAERDAKSAGKDKKSNRSSEKSECHQWWQWWIPWSERCGETAAGKEEQDDWKPVGKRVNSLLTFSRNAKNSSRSNLQNSTQAIGGARLLIWLISFSRVSTARTGDHIIAGVAAEEPPEQKWSLWPFVKDFENKGPVHWLWQDDKESGEELLKRASQQAADEGTPGPCFFGLWFAGNPEAGWNGSKHLQGQWVFNVALLGLSWSPS